MIALNHASLPSSLLYADQWGWDLGPSSGSRLPRGDISYDNFEVKRKPR